jgi:CheY-like chemotaxis protein
MVAPLLGSVLVVDDEPQVFSAFRRVARTLPVRLRFASSGREAIQLVSAEIPELIITDYLLTDFDGLELIRRVRNFQPGVKCLLYTAHPLAAKARGVDVPVLAKPCSADNLRDLLRALTTPAQSLATG